MIGTNTVNDMKKEDIIKKMNAILAEEFEVEEELITAEAPVKETLHLDSLSLVDMIGLVEEEFGVTIKTEDVKTIKTFDDLYNYVANNI